MSRNLLDFLELSDNQTLRHSDIESVCSVPNGTVLIPDYPISTELMHLTAHCFKGIRVWFRYSAEKL
ncbi:MAG TPA: hypothetical protein PK199_10050 [Bacteroidales bacterium]|nr:hypothetical protein [Bacteroidales bacterium]